MYISIFGKTNLEFIDFYVHGAITLLRHLRKGSEELNHVDKEDNIEEAGFDLDQDEMNKFHIWPLGVIPYYIDDYSFDKVLRDTIRAFLDHTGRITGLRFLELLQPPEDGSRWVFFINRQGLLGCQDHPFNNFTNEGVQKVVLGYDCLKSENGMGEIILSLVGVPPQHNAPNRDNFIKIKKDNIMPDKLKLFKILRDDEWLFHDIEYDFKSVGHYDSHKYTVNGAATILPQDATLDMEIGPGKCFSYRDIQKIKMLYNFIISKHKDNARLPECLKIFSPGPKFKSYKPKKKDAIAPRKKPNKYSGIKDEEPEKLVDVSGSKETKDKKKSIKKEDTQDGTLENVKHESHEEHDKSHDDLEKNGNTVPSDKNEDKNSDQSDKLKRDKDDTTPRSLKSKYDKKNIKKNLLDLSDYATGEEN
ncbi:unnamed protein product [Colias eurytheme]|nr:unnamed protein product [Colias eurytheme]